MLKEITIEVTQKCCNRCIYCSSCSSMLAKNELETKTIIETLQNAYHKLGARQVNISGGEPFLHPDIIYILKIAKNIGYTVHIYSSGVYTKGSKESISDYRPIPEEYIQACADVGIDKIFFNMQSPTDEMHAIITGIKGQTQVNRDISIAKFVASGISVEVNVVPIGINKDMLDEICAKAIGLGCSRINILGLVMQGRATKHKKQIVINDVEHMFLKNTLLAIVEKHGDKVRVGSPLDLKGKSIERCYAGVGRLSVRYDGKVFPCEAYKFLKEISKEQPLSIKEHSIDEIYKQSGFLNTIQDQIKADKHATCKDCPAQQNLGYNCAFDKIETGQIPEYLDTRKSENIFKAHMNNYLASSVKDLELVQIDCSKISAEIKAKIVQQNYLFLNHQLLESITTAHVLRTRGNTVKAFSLDWLNIQESEYKYLREGNLVNLSQTSYSLSSSNEFSIIYEPVILDPVILSESAKARFYMEYLHSFIFPDNLNIKHMLVATSNPDFEKALNQTGFIQIKDMGLYKLYEYILPNQFCLKNMLGIVRG